MTRYMLTTKDNPFDHTCNVLADRAIVSNGQLSKEEDEQSISDAIDEIIIEFPMIEYEKVQKEY